MDYKEQVKKDLETIKKATKDVNDVLVKHGCIVVNSIVIDPRIIQKRVEDEVNNGKRKKVDKK